MLARTPLARAWFGQGRPSISLVRILLVMLLLSFLTFLLGIALYYLSPNFNGNFMQFELDGVPSGDVNLTRWDRSMDSPDPQVFWYKTDLENKEHSLELSPGTYNSTVFVDAFTQVQTFFLLSETLKLPYYRYTVLDDTDVPPATSVLSKVAAPTAQQAAASTSSAQDRISIGLGVPFGVIILTIFFGIAWLLRKNMRSRSARYSWKAPVPPLRIDPPTSFEAGYTQSSKQSTYSPRMGETTLPSIRPLPPIPGSVTSHYEEARMYGSPSPGPLVQQSYPRDRNVSPDIPRNNTYLSTGTRLEPNRRKVASPPPNSSGNKSDHNHYSS